MIEFSVAKDFSKTPKGRYRIDGNHSGEEFRQEFLIPILKKNKEIRIDLDGTKGYSSSFLEEAFGGLIRSGLLCSVVKSLLHFKTSDGSLKDEIWGYIESAIYNKNEYNNTHKSIYLHGDAMQYRKKPIVIEAIKIKDCSYIQVLEFCPIAIVMGIIGNIHGYTIPTMEGNHFAGMDDYLIKGIKGEFYPCKPDIFEATYDKVEESINRES